MGTMLANFHMRGIMLVLRAVLDLSCCECYVISLYFMCCSVIVSVCLVFVHCLVKQLAICLGVVAILLLNVMEMFSVGGDLCWIDRVWCSKECACCVCDPSLHLSVPFIGFVLCFVCRKLSPHLTV